MPNCALMFHSLWSEVMAWHISLRTEKWMPFTKIYVSHIPCPSFPSELQYVLGLAPQQEKKILLKSTAAANYLLPQMTTAKIVWFSFKKIILYCYNCCQYISVIGAFYRWSFSNFNPLMDCSLSIVIIQKKCTLAFSQCWQQQLENCGIFAWFLTSLTLMRNIWMR